MIEVSEVTKEYPVTKGAVRVLDKVNFSLAPGEKLAVLGRNGSGKSTLLKLIGGVEEPTSGRIRREMSLSWPLGFQGGFHPHLTGYDNVRFIARVYDQPTEDVFAFTDDFAELGKYMYMPIETYSTGMRARLAFGLSFAISFDCYLIDEVILAGDQRFHRKCRDELFNKRSDRALILASHALDIVREACSSALVLKGGRAKLFRDIDVAIQIYAAL